MKAARTLQYSRDDSTAFLGRAPTEKDAYLMNAYASLSIARAIDNLADSLCHAPNIITDALVGIDEQIEVSHKLLKSKKF